jgi:hypothetical protein
MCYASLRPGHGTFLSLRGFASSTRGTRGLTTETQKVKTVEPVPPLDASPGLLGPQLGTKPIKGPPVWTGEDLTQSHWWNHHLSNEELDDIHNALVAAKKSGAVSWIAPGVPDKIPKEAFPLGLGMQQKLADLSDELENGKGAIMIRNMPVEDPRFTEDDLAVMYLGLCAHIGHVVLQSSSGLRSVSRGYGLPLGRVQAEMSGETPKGGKQTNNHFRFHTDRCDVVSLLGIRVAPRGGASRIASAPAIYNAMLERFPELALELQKPIDRIWEGQNGFFSLPVWGLTPCGKFTTQISPSYVESAQYLQDTNVKKVSDMQIQALDVLEDLAMDLGVEYKTLPGMLTFFNNHQVYHGRGNWSVTSAEMEGQWGNKGRLLLRTWVSPYNSRELPDTPEYRFVWGSTKAGTLRGGYDQAMDDVPRPKPPESFEYYSLYSKTTQQRSMNEQAATVLNY